MANYDYPFTPELTWVRNIPFSKGVHFKQIGQETFKIEGLRKADLKHLEYLHKQLRLFAPVETGRLLRSYKVWYVKSGVFTYTGVIENTVRYFRHPYGWYRGVSKRGKPLVRYDFVAEPVRNLISKAGISDEKEIRFPTRTKRV